MGDVTTKMIELLLLVILILVFYGLGKRILKWLKIDNLSLSADFVFAEGLGLVIVFVLMFFIGLGGLYYTSVAYLVILVAALITLPEIFSLIRKIPQHLSWLKQQPLDWLSCILLVFFGLHIFLGLINALAPPTGFWDALTTYLAIPEIWVKNHGLINIPFLAFSYWPHNMSMVFVLGRLLINDTLGILIQYWLSLLVLFAIYAFCRSHLNSKKIGILSMTIFCVGVGFSHSLSFSAGTNFANTFFIFLSLYSFLNWRKHSKPGWLVISAVFSGCAAGIRLTGFIPIMFFLVLLYCDLFKTKTLLPTIRNILIYSVPALLFAAPWYLRSYILTNNPFFPFLFNVFDGNHWNSDIATYYSNSFKEVGMGKNILQFLLWPWNVTVNAGYFNGAIINFGPIFLALLPFLLCIRKIPAVIKFLLGFSLFFSIMWFWFLTHSLRHLFAITPLLSICVAYVLIRLLSTNMSGLKKITFSFLFFSLIFNMGYVVYANLINFKLPVVIGLESNQDYYQRNLPMFEVYDFIENNLPQGTKIIFMRETRGYGCPRPYIWARPNFSAFIDYRSIKDINELHEITQQLQATHILVSTGYQQDKVLGWEREFALTNQFIQHYGQLIFKTHESILFEIK